MHTPTPCDILVVLENDMYVRNFVTSGVLDGLVAGHHRGDWRLGILTSELVDKLKDAIPAELHQGVYPRIKKNVRYTYECNVASMRALQNQSTTFVIKTQKQLYKSPHQRWYKLLAHASTANRIRQYFADKFKPNPDLEALVSKIRPKVVLFPVTGVESTGTELIRLGERVGFKTLYLQNGWDNLSSKGVFPLLPQAMGVWGPQSLLHAVQIQGMAPNKVHLLGCARYESYLDALKEDLPSPFGHPYILFAGATTACDELTPLRALDEALTRLGVSDLKIVYRPHPWREPRAAGCADTFEASDFRHVILDPQVAPAYYQEKASQTEGVASANYPALSYYPQLVKHASFVVSPMSSMTLEAALFDIPTLILAMDDGFHKIPGNLQAQYAHFAGGRDIEGWYYVDTMAQLDPTFTQLVQRAVARGGLLRQPGLHTAMEHYLYADGRPYRDRLTDWVVMMLAHTPTTQRPSRDAALPNLVSC